MQLIPEKCIPNIVKKQTRHVYIVIHEALQQSGVKCHRADPYGSFGVQAEDLEEFILNTVSMHDWGLFDGYFWYTAFFCHDEDETLKQLHLVTEDALLREQPAHKHTARFTKSGMRYLEFRAECNQYGMPPRSQYCYHG